MVTASDPTVLTLTGIGVMPYSARGLSQSLDPIDQSSHIERTINGELIDLGYEPFRKYKSTITGSDQRPPAVDGKWPGTTVIVECIATLCHPDSETFGREPVDYDDAVSYEAGFVTYRPRLTMMVINYSTEHDEWGAVVGWKMDLEEI